MPSFLRKLDAMCELRFKYVYINYNSKYMYTYIHVYYMYVPCSFITAEYKKHVIAAFSTGIR